MHVQSCCFAHEFDILFDVVVVVVVAYTPYEHENHALFRWCQVPLYAK